MKNIKLPSILDNVDMITNEMIRLFFTITAFLLIMAKGQKNCSLLVPSNVAANMPLAYTVNSQQQASIVYPNSDGDLIVEYNSEIVLSCVSTKFALEALKTIKDLTVKCLGGSLFQYKEKTYEFVDLKCLYYPRSSMIVTNRVCKPNNNTVVTVGFKTENYYFTLYSACFDKITKSSLYTWYDVRFSYFKSHEKKQRSRLYTKYEDLYDPLNVEDKYNVKIQRGTLNAILNLSTDSEKFINDWNYLTHGHFIAKSDFYFAREQRATFNYVNITPQWLKLNDSWSIVENEFRNNLDKNVHNRRVIVAGMYGQCTLTDAENKQQPLYLAMPEKQLVVPMFLWRLFYDADNRNIDVVYIGLNNPYASKEVVKSSKLQCKEIQCPWPSIKYNQKTKPLQLYCCTKESFEQAYGKFDPEIFDWPQIVPIA